MTTISFISIKISEKYLISESVEEFFYTKDGKEIKGFQYKFKMEFSQKTAKQR